MPANDFISPRNNGGRLDPWPMFPPSNGEVIDISGDDHTISNAAGCTRIWIGGGGDLTVRLRHATEDVTYSSIPDGFEFVGNVTIVRDTTTCTEMTADWPEVE